MVAQEANPVPGNWLADQPKIMAVWLAFAPYLQASDLEPATVDLLAVRLASRILGLKLGTPGPRLPESDCRKCWGEHYVWLGDRWGRRHARPSHKNCQHDCHAVDELPTWREPPGILP
jgi:hypothetical protein